MPRPTWLLRLACLLVCTAPVRARGDDPHQLSIAAVGSCPSAQLVLEELRLLMPEARLWTSDDVIGSDVIVSDGGVGFTVRVRGQRRRFRDGKHDCTERARHVAVFTVLIVDPLRVPGPQQARAQATKTPEKSEQPEPEPPAAPAPSARRGATLDLSLGPLAQVAVRSESLSATQAGGLGMRLRFGAGWGVSFGLAGLLPTSLHFPSAEARASWMPMDLSLSLSQELGSWELLADAGVAGALLLVEGQGQALDATRQAARLEAGGKAAAQVRYWASHRAGVYGGVSGTWFPQPYTLEVAGVGSVGRTPSGWIGGSLGAVIRF